MLHCDLRPRWEVASDFRFRAAISEPKTPSFCGISGDLAPSTRKSLAIAIVRFWCAKDKSRQLKACQPGSKQCTNSLTKVQPESNSMPNDQRHTPSTAGNSMTGSERRSPEPLLKKEASSPAVLGGREFWKCSGSLKQMP